MWMRLAWLVSFVFVSLTSGIVTGPANSTYRVVFNVGNLEDGSSGSFTIEIHPEWAPKGVRRFRELLEHQFFEQGRFFRVVPGFMAQFGISGDPAISNKWKNKDIEDDPVTQRNDRGRISFASAGKNTRTTQIFINFKNNRFLDHQGFAPIGEVIVGMDVVDRLYGGYGDCAPDGKGPSQEEIEGVGNGYLMKDFPKLTYIESVEIVAPEPSVLTVASAFYMMHRTLIVVAGLIFGCISSGTFLRYLVHRRKFDHQFKAGDWLLANGWTAWTRLTTVWTAWTSLTAGWIVWASHKGRQFRWPWDFATKVNNPTKKASDYGV